MNRIKKFTGIFIAVSLTLLLCAAPAAAADAQSGSQAGYESAGEKLRDPDGEIIGVSSRGLWHSYPENSLEGILAAGETGIDFVLTDVKKTADGTLILFKDDSARRMLDISTQADISALTYEEISQYRLKEGLGGASAQVSDYTVPTLRTALQSAKKAGFSLMLNISAELLPELTQLLIEEEALSDTAVITEASYKEIKAQTDKLSEKPMIIGIKRSNIIFEVTSFTDKLYENSAVGVNLKTTNRYGVNFYKSVLGRFSGKLRAVANPAESETCGARQDSEKWWNDLISRGYSVIITDYPELFCKYLERCDDVRSSLNSYYIKYTEQWRLPQFKSYIFNDFRKAYNDATAQSKALLSDKSSSLQDMNDCLTALQKAVDNINLNYEELEKGTAGLTLTAPRILLCLLAAAAVTAAQIFFFKKRKKTAV